MKKAAIVMLCSFLTVIICCLAGIGIWCSIKITSSYLDSSYSNKLIEAIEKKDKPEIDRILEKRPSCINAPHTCIPEGMYILITEYRRNYPIIAACSTFDYEIIETLIEAGADVNLNNGVTPLSVIYASKSDNWIELSMLLIENGASLDYITEYSGGKSAVFRDIVTCYSNATVIPEEVVWVFNYALEHCDQSNVDWMRVLQHSVTNERFEIVRLLLDEGYCHVNDCTHGMTALMFAAWESTPEMAQLLLDYGADISVISIDGKTAYDYAVEIENEGVARLLEEAEQQTVSE